jgi:hypothetical protein
MGTETPRAVAVASTRPDGHLPTSSRIIAALRGARTYGRSPVQQTSLILLKRGLQLIPFPPGG